ncbi:sugar phosphate isomerase/epimerase family protein [Chloroflexota bacterium]
MQNLIGIMQGRLSPTVGGKIQAFPWNNWEQEFLLAKEVGLDLIDWVAAADRFYENPLLTAEGARTIKALVSETGVQVGAVCAHYFVDCPLLRCSDSERKERLDVLDLLIDRLNILGIKYLEIPLLENSAIGDEVELERTIQIIKPGLDKAYQLEVNLSFETSLPAEMFRAFLSALNHPAARATYDMGNSASLGYNPKEELESYGELVTTVHIKDRLLGGGTVPLGEGNTDFAMCFSMLRAKNYAGPFILEVARAINEIAAARKNVAFVKNWLNK